MPAFNNLQTEEDEDNDDDLNQIEPPVKVDLKFAKGSENDFLQIEDQQNQVDGALSKKSKQLNKPKSAGTRKNNSVDGHGDKDLMQVHDLFDQTKKSQQQIDEELDEVQTVDITQQMTPSNMKKKRAGRKNTKEQPSQGNMEDTEVTNQSSNSKKKQSKQKKLAEKIAVKKLQEKVQSIHGAAAPEEDQAANAASKKQKATGVFDQLNELYDEDLANQEQKLVPINEESEEYSATQSRAFKS